MYNKLFTKILDSSIWMESLETRIVWLTFIAAMDEHGFVPFASVENVAHRARVDCNAAVTACNVLERPDPNSSDPENDGRRIERVPGGWMVLNSAKYRNTASKADAQEQTRQRVKKHRERRNAPVTVCNAPVTGGNVLVTPSEAYTKAKAEEKTKAKRVGNSEPAHLDGKLLDEIECPQSKRSGFLKLSQPRGSHPAGFWCRVPGGCGLNFAADFEPIVGQMTSGGRKAVQAMAPKVSEAEDPNDAAFRLLDEQGMILGKFGRTA